jgi:hypothetical protein
MYWCLGIFEARAVDSPALFIHLDIFYNFLLKNAGNLRCSIHEAGAEILLASVRVTVRLSYSTINDASILLASARLLPACWTGLGHALIYDDPPGNVLPTATVRTSESYPRI